MGLLEWGFDPTLITIHRKVGDLADALLGSAHPTNIPGRGYTINL
jgi:hypothetical protein